MHGYEARVALVAKGGTTPRLETLTGSTPKDHNSEST